MTRLSTIPALLVLIGLCIVIPKDLQFVTNQPSVQLSTQKRLAQEEKELSNKRTAAKLGNKVIDDQAIDLRLTYVLWQEKKFKQAEKLLTNLLDKQRTPQSDRSQNPIELKLELASLYLDQGKFEKAIEFYRGVLDLDRQHPSVASNAHVARDLNDLGVSFYMFGISSKDKEKGRQLLAQSLNYFKDAAQIYTSLPPGAGSVFQMRCVSENQAIAQREFSILKNSPSDKPVSSMRSLITGGASSRL